MNKCKILLSYSCRSDEALINPIAKKLKEEDWCELYRTQLDPGFYLDSYMICDRMFDLIDYDLVIIIGDRIEQMALCQCAFLHNIPIAHLGSGITNTIATFDDVNRHSMALMADICLVENFKAYTTTRRLHDAIGKTAIIETVGNLYLEGLTDIDESLVPDEPYDLVLMNLETLNNDEIEIMFQERFTIRIGENPDGKVYKNWKKNEFMGFKDYDNLPRAQFLGLMKRCHRFITNSSCAYYEAPAFLKPEQIILIGERNKGRSSYTEWPQQYKTSNVIVSTLKKYWVSKQ